MADHPSFEDLLLHGAHVHTDADVSKLMNFYAQESLLFHTHMQAAAAQFAATGELPGSLFKRGGGAGKAGGTKRKPSAFNLYVKRKMAEFKEKGVKGPTDGSGGRNPLFKMAVDSWGTLTDEEKKAFAAQCKEMEVEGEEEEYEEAEEDEEEEESE